LRAVLREAKVMRQYCGVAIALSMMITASLAVADDAPSTNSSVQAQDTSAPKPPEATPKAGAAQEKAQAPKANESLQELLERQTREINALKEQYARDMEQQKKRAELQQAQLDILTKTTRVLGDQLKKQQGDAPSKEAIDKLEAKTDRLESRAEQAAKRDEVLASKDDDLFDMLDAARRSGPQWPSALRGMFSPTPTNVAPFSVLFSTETIYQIIQGQRGAGTIQLEEFSPFFLVQLNKRLLISAETVFTVAGVSLEQAQVDYFINDWLTAEGGWFLAPTGFYNDRLNMPWFQKFPDNPLAMQQAIPFGLSLTGLQLRGSRYLFKSPIKMEYGFFATNGLGVPGSGSRADWSNLMETITTDFNVNNSAAYGGRVALWLPARGINFGVSEFVNAPYSKNDGAYMSIWQPYFNYHRGNWDFRFEYGNMYEQTQAFIGNNIQRQGLYAQLAYRNYPSMHKHLQRLEPVFRFSEARFKGIDQGALNISSYASPVFAPVDRNQYTIGLNYYLYASTMLKVAYEINQEVGKNLKDNVFMLQFATNF
jgi:hypothetical protein